MSVDLLYFAFSNYLDQFLFLVLCLSVWLWHDRFRLRQRTKTSFRVGLAGVVVILVAGAMLASLYVSEFQRTQMRASIAGFAPTYAIELQEHGHEHVRDVNDSESETYLGLIDRQIQWKKVNPSAHSVYTMRRMSDGTVQIIVDPENDYDKNGVIDGENEARTDIGELYEDYTDAMMQAFDGEVAFDDVPYSDRWGVWVSAYAPIYAADGSVDGLVGVDFSAAEWIKTLLVARGVVLVISFGIIVALVAGLSFNATLHHQLELTHLFSQQLQAQTKSLQEANEEISRARDSANQASRAKSDFLANMSHEIRTPMNGIMGLTELVLNTELQAEQRRHLELIQSSADALMTVLNDILDFSKIEANKMTLDPHPFDIRDMLGDALKLFGLRAHHKQIELAFRISSDVPDRVVGDAGRIRQVLVNLVGNAIKFTHEGEVVVSVDAIACDSDACRLKFHVRDTGIGIDKAGLARLFEPFNQADNSTTRKYGGTGLGLTICQRLVHLMGGTLVMESEPGVGTSVQFELICQRPLDAATAVALEEQVTLDNVRVLVVDDNSTNRLILKEMLASWHVESVVLESGYEAVPALERAFDEGKPFDLVLMDLQMPDIDGFETTQLIRGSEKAKQTRVMMLSSCDASAFTEQVKEMELSAYLTKPIKQSELLECMLSVLKRGTPNSQRLRARGNDAQGNSATKNLRPLKILVAEDNFVNQQLILRVLTKAGHEVNLANHGLEAVEYLARNTVDIVLMDCQMPNMDGYTATGEIRKAGRTDRSGGRLPIVALTANAMRGDREKCLEAGMDDYASKPIQFAKLFEVMANMVAEPWAQEQAKPGVEVSQTFAQKVTEVERSQPGVESSSEPSESSDVTIACEAPLSQDVPLNQVETNSEAVAVEEYPVLDRNELRDRIDGDLELLAILFESFDGDVNQQFSELERQVEAGNWEVARRIAHTLKGTSANLGGTRAAKSAAELERQLKECQRPEPSVIPAVKQNTADLCAELRQVISSQSL
ncbi:MAG: response regulator [Planctomycetaceae bacterium]|nr:response regulator [Planctomycetaceae bacterium]